jgi:hypothetical protein
MGTTVSGLRPISMGLVPFVDDDEAECVEQAPPKCGIQLIRMLRRNQADLAGKIEIEECDFTVPAPPGRVAHDCAGDGML